MFAAPFVEVGDEEFFGDGAFGGDSIFSENVLPKMGTGATSQRHTNSQQSRGESGVTQNGGERDQMDADFRVVEKDLMGRGGETMVMDNMLRHVVTRITDEGLVIELFALDDLPLFEGASAVPTQLLRDLGSIVASVGQTVTNGVAIRMAILYLLAGGRNAGKVG